MQSDTDFIISWKLDARNSRDILGKSWNFYIWNSSSFYNP